MSEIKCPHCQTEQDTTDWLEYGGEDGVCFEHECVKCEEIFEVVTSIEVSYRVLTEVLDD